jgi:isopropylmalate/homocitrate/citramalate synthase
MNMLSAEKTEFILKNRDEPELFRESFPFDAVPRIRFDGVEVPLNPPRDIWITDTTFRDGQQARPPYNPEQIADIFTFLHRLGGKKGLIRQSEFFIYSDKDRKALELCREKGYAFPEITSWIRASAEDLKLVKALGIRETGILTSISDYHIYLKLKSDRKKTMEEFLSVVRAALEAGILPRCHFEDITRADIYGFCLPFAQELLRLSQDSGKPIKIRLCDTMGYGVTYPGASLPRSVPRLVHAFRSELGYPAEWLEWHGHNDFHKVHVNGSTAWLYGCSALNASLLGYGERTGNPPLEAAIVEYMSLTGDDSVDLSVITEMADYFRQVIKAEVPDNYPFVGAEFNTTRAGIHADGILKNPEIYNIFDTEKLLKRPVKVMVTDKSGMAGIARWINENIVSILKGQRPEVTKRHPGIFHINKWILKEYEQGRTTSISSQELEALTRRFLPSLFESDFDRVKAAAVAKARSIAEEVASAPQLADLRPEAMEPYLEEIVKREGSIQLLAITNPEGFRISTIYAQHGEKALFRNLLNKDFTKHDWFMEVIASGEPYYSDLFFSKYTKRLIITAALPIKNRSGGIRAVIDIDFRFDELTKLLNDLPSDVGGAE